MLDRAAVIKLARCWAGYEPVPGKKPYSNDSCRPAGSKKKKKTEKKAAGSGSAHKELAELEDWQMHAKQYDATKADRLKKLQLQRAKNAPDAHMMAASEKSAAYTFGQQVAGDLEKHAIGFGDMGKAIGGGLKSVGTGIKNFGRAYGDTFNRYYNPTSEAWQQPSKDPIDAGLKWTGRAALGTGAAAGVAAGSLAAAPTVASAANSAYNAALPTMAAGGAGLQNVSNRLQNAVVSGAQRGKTMLDAAALGYQQLSALGEKLHYSPDAMAQDALAAGTGNFDSVQGPANGGLLRMGRDIAHTVGTLARAPSTPATIGVAAQ